MRALAPIPSAADRVVYEGGATLPSSTGDQPSVQSFDQVMAGALSASETDETTRSDQPGKAPTVSGTGGRSAVSTPAQRRQVNQPRNITSEEAAPAAVEKSISWLDLSDPSVSHGTEGDSENNSGKRGGDATATDRKEFPVGTGLPGVMAPLAAVLPTGLLSSAAENRSPLVKKAISTALSPPTAKAAAGANGLGALTTHGKAEALAPATETIPNPKVLSDQREVEKISNLADVGRPENAVEVSDTNDWKTNTGDLPSDSPPITHLRASAHQSPAYPAGDGAGLKAAIEPAVYWPQSGASPAKDWRAANLSPVPSQSGGSADTISDAVTSQTPALPTNDLPATTLQSPAYPALDGAGLKAAIEPAVYWPQSGASPAKDWRAASLTPTPTRIGGSAAAMHNTVTALSVALPATDLPASALQSPAYPASEMAGLKTDIESAVYWPQPGTSPTTDWRAANLSPVPSQPGGSADTISDAVTSQTPALPKTDLPSSALQSPAHPAGDGAGLKTAIEPAVYWPQPGASPARDWRAASLTPTPTRIGGSADAMSNTVTQPSAALPTNDLSASALQSPAYPAVDGAGLKTAIEPAVYWPQPVASPTTSDETTLEVEPFGAGGTPVAKLFLPMEKNGKMNKIAGLAGTNEKLLPDAADLAAPENNLPSPDLFARFSSRHEAGTAAIGLSARGIEQPAAPVQDSVPISSVVDLRARALERTHDMIALQTVRLVDARLDSLHVVIKPGAGMELSLEMRRNGDGIDVQAVLQRGDFGPMNLHWPELQQRLESRGVHLSPLVGGDQGDHFAGNSSGNGFQSPPREFTNPDPLEASAFAAFALAGPAALSPRPALAAAFIGQGWETWA